VIVSSPRDAMSVHTRIEHSPVVNCWKYSALRLGRIPVVGRKNEGRVVLMVRKEGAA